MSIEKLSIEDVNSDGMDAYYAMRDQDEASRCWCCGTAPRAEPDCMGFCFLGGDCSVPLICN